MRSLTAVLLLVWSFTARGESIFIRHADDALVTAIEKGDAAATRRALTSGGCNTGRFEAIAGTPLSLAVMRGHEKVVAVLLEFKANVASPENAAGLPDGWNLRCGARLHGTAIEALLAKAHAAPPTEGCLGEVRFILAAKKGSEREVRAAKLPEGLSLTAASLALQQAIASAKPAVVTAVIEVSGNPRLAEHANVPHHTVRDPALRQALGQPALRE